MALLGGDCAFPWHHHDPPSGACLKATPGHGNSELWATAGRPCDLALRLLPPALPAASLFLGAGDSLGWAASLLGRGRGLLARFPGGSGAQPGGQPSQAPPCRGAEHILGPRDSCTRQGLCSNPCAATRPLGALSGSIPKCKMTRHLPLGAALGLKGAASHSTWHPPGAPAACPRWLLSTETSEPALVSHPQRHGVICHSHLQFVLFVYKY